MKLYLLKENNNLYDVEEGVIAVCTSVDKCINLMNVLADEEQDSLWDSIEINEAKPYREFTTLDMSRKDGAYRSFEIVECITDDFI